MPVRLSFALLLWDIIGTCVFFGTGSWFVDVRREEDTTDGMYCYILVKGFMRHAQR